LSPFSVIEDVERQEEIVAKSLGITEEDYAIYGGPAEIFEDLLYPVLVHSRESILSLDPANQTLKK
jgi:hypothetical protein